MPWVIGIDEAGYGPNLGPLVMSAVACRVPAEVAGADFWTLLRAAVRRPSDPGDERIVIGDSKQVYSPARGLQDLESSVLATLYHLPDAKRVSLRRCLGDICPQSIPALRSEPWFRGTSRLPIVADRVAFDKARQRFLAVSVEQHFEWGQIQTAIVCPQHFNGLLDRWGTKGAVLGQALGDLLIRSRKLCGSEEPAHFIVDKHGGRNTYAAMLQDALPDGMVVATEEGNLRSVYSFLGPGPPIRLTFQPRADQEHLCVALASMISKYLREVLMREFNRFWTRQVPDLKPTAGYPGDALRFYRAIMPAAARLRIPEEVLWRRR